MCLPALPLIGALIGGAGLLMQRSAQKKAEKEREQIAAETKAAAEAEKTTADQNTRDSRAKLYKAQGIQAGAMAAMGSTPSSAFGARSFFSPRA